MALREHSMALRAPWYVLERQDLTRFDPESFGPALQKYNAPDFVERLLRDPRESVKFVREDHWSFSAPISPGTATGLRERLAGRRQIVTPLRKLFLPSHERYYAVTAELFCDADGLPRPGTRDDVTVEFVVRRVKIQASGPLKTVRDLALALAKLYAKKDRPKPPPHDSIVRFWRVARDRDMREDVVALGSIAGDDLAAIEADHPGLVAAAKIRRLVDGWYVDEDGRGRWLPVPLEVGDPVPPLTEERLPMWQLSPSIAQCDPAQSRSLWFGLLPTTSGDQDPERQPKFSDRDVYVVQCVASKKRRPGPEQCPPLVAESAPSRPYRLAAFFDPAGTSHRQVRVRLPDLRALAAQAGDPAAAGGGIEFERPAGSQLPIRKFGEIPTDSDQQPGGTTAEFCTFAIELITIVASFVLALFMPVVILVFQLWWLLLLKFCWPPSAQAEALIGALADNTALDTLTAPQRRVFAQTAGFPRDVDVVAHMKDTRSDLTSTAGTAKPLVGSLAPEDPPLPQLPEPETRPADPLCALEIPP
jgi:hypothetical protein